MIPLAIPNIGEAEARNLRRCVDDNFVSSVGPFVTELEQRVAAMSGTRHAVAMGAGTQGLHMALHACGVGRDDLVILPSFTFIASANSISHTGASPWLFDIEPDSWTLQPEQVAQALARDTERRGDALVHRPTGRRVGAIMPVYTLGTPADMDALGAIARTYRLPLIADAAAAIGVGYDGRAIGTLADLTCYSFNGNKTITCGGGGMVAGDDDALMKRIRHLSTTARVTRDYDHDEVGWNYRMTNVQAAIGCAQADRLNDFLAVKRLVRESYDRAFAKRSDVAPFPAPAKRGTTYWFSGIVLERGHRLSAAQVCQGLATHGVEARTFWRPIHLQKPYAQVPCEDQSVSEDVWTRIVTLPCSTNLTQAEIDHVIGATLSVLDSVSVMV
jgi:dTDP-4-amino-4,6-dideoxygalactose transaminase